MKEGTRSLRISVVAFQDDPDGSKPFMYHPCFSAKYRWTAYLTTDGESPPCTVLGRDAYIGLKSSSIDFKYGEVTSESLAMRASSTSSIETDPTVLAFCSKNA